MNFLQEILSQKKIEIEEAKKKLSFAELKSRVRGIHPRNDFKNAVTRRNGQHVRVIAEIKRASPSKGMIADNVDPSGLAQEYVKGGASAISILTEERYFKGTPSDLENVRAAVPEVPLLRKDFIADEYQVYESLRLGADAILLIVAALSKDELRNFVSLAKDLRLSSLVEVHSETELESALSAGAEIVGVNNRNLMTFEVSPAVSDRLAAKLTDGIVSVSESGIKDVSGIRAAFESGYDAVLIGEHFMRANDRVAEVKKFANVSVNQNPEVKNPNDGSESRS